MIGRVDWSGHTFFGEWKQSRHDPNGSDDVVGSAEEFGMSAPLGYADAKPGETFIKIDVGDSFTWRNDYRLFLEEKTTH